MLNQRALSPQHGASARVKIKTKQKVNTLRFSGKIKMDEDLFAAFEDDPRDQNKPKEEDEAHETVE